MCFQALLSAHDVVGLKDYEPVLPPLPEDLANNEEAMRIVCMVKNNQPLVRILCLFACSAEGVIVTSVER